MNNLNDPTDWNVRPYNQGGEDGDRWKYALLVPMLCLAAFRWAWSRDTQRKIQEVESKHERTMVVLKELQVENRQQEKLRAKNFLEVVETDLLERQNAYCSRFISYQRRVQIERKLLDMVAREPLATGINMEADLKNIFEKERHCAAWYNKDKSQNGSMMWYFLKDWQRQISQHTTRKEGNAIPNKPQPNLK